MAESAPVLDAAVAATAPPEPSLSSVLLTELSDMSLLEPTVMALCLGLFTVLAMLYSCYQCTPSAPGNKRTWAQRLFSVYMFFGRARNLLLSPWDRMRKRYPVANTCQIPFFSDLSALYNFVFGYKTEGMFVEIGAFDGESFSNTSCLADLGWRGHYVEPIPAYAKACAARHAGNAGVQVHNICCGEVDGDEVELSAAGPFTSAVPDEIAAVQGSKMAGALEALGWAHVSDAAAGTAAPAQAPSEPAQKRQRANSSALPKKAPAPAHAASSSGSSSGRQRASSGTLSTGGYDKAAPPAVVSPDGLRVSTTTVSLNTFFERQRIQPGEVDVMVVDTEGFEWPILRGFDLAHWRPKLVIVEIQEKQARYRHNARVQADALQIEDAFQQAGYSVLYRDVVNCVFVDRNVPCVGGD